MLRSDRYALAITHASTPFPPPPPPPISLSQAGAAASSPSAPPAPQHHISRVDTTGLLSTEARLTALYRMNDPTKDAMVIAEKFRRGGFGDESQLFSLLIQKYGQEAIDASDAAALDELMDEV